MIFVRCWHLNLLERSFWENFWEKNWQQWASRESGDVALLVLPGAADFLNFKKSVVNSDDY